MSGGGGCWNKQASTQLLCRFCGICPPRARFVSKALVGDAPSGKEVMGTVPSHVAGLAGARWQCQQGLLSSFPLYGKHFRCRSGSQQRDFLLIPFGSSMQK